MKKIIGFAVPVLLVLIAVPPMLRNTEHQDLTPQVRARAPGQMIALSHGAVHYETGGPADGQPVVLVHGFSVPSYVWDPTFEALSAAGFRVVRYDLYGRGYSDRPDVTYDRALFVGQLVELLDSLRIARPVDIVGLSMGGPITAAFAADHPERIRRLAFIDPMTRAEDISPLDLPVVGEYLNRVYLVPSLPERQLQDFAHPERFPGWADQYREQMRYRGFGSAILSTLRHFINRDPMPDFRTVGAQQHPLLFVWGEEDRTLPVAQRQRVRAVLAGSDFVVVPQAGHLPHYERPEVVNASLIAFLTRP